MHVELLEIKISGEKKNVIILHGINMLMQWELRLRMRGTRCDVMFASLWKGTWWLEWRFLNSATASQLELLCARFLHFCPRRDSLIVENYSEISSERWEIGQCYPCIPLTGFPFLPGKNKWNNSWSIYALLAGREWPQKETRHPVICLFIKKKKEDVYPWCCPTVFVAIWMPVSSYWY